jgi:4a-hydroxytetrahydrobiopterin dehydratase
MTDLAAKRCAPCEEGTKALAGDELQELLRQVEGWKLVDGKKIEKEYRFPDFKEALAFVDRLGAIAEEEGHHPDIYLGWGRVKVELSTHSVGGLSENDFILAAKIDGILA